MAPLLKSFVVGLVTIGVLQGPTIRHQGLEYVSSREFPRIEMTVDRPHLVRSAKLYFRAEQYADFYYVEMVRDEDRDTFFAILPMPLAQTAAMIYFVEVVDTAFNPIRTGLFEAKVTAQPVAGSYQGPQPNINVGSTAPQGADIPPGFQADGIQGIIQPNGSIQPLGKSGGSGGGGGGVAAAVLIGAGAAGGVGYLVLKQQEDESTTTTTAIPRADLAVTKTPSIAGDVQVRALFTFELRATNNGPDRATNVQLTDTVPSGYRISRTEFPGNASCSQSGQTIQCTASALDSGASIRVLYEVSGVEPNATLTNRVEVRANEEDPNSSNNSASVTKNIIRPPRVADISVEVQDRGDFRFQVDLRNNGPTATISDIDLTVTSSPSSEVQHGDETDVLASGFTGACPVNVPPPGLFTCETSLGPNRTATVSFTLRPNGNGTLSISAAVECEDIDPNCTNNSDSVTVKVSSLRTDEPSARVPLTLTTSLESASDRQLRGDVTLNGESLGGVTGQSPRSISTNGFGGSRNIVEAWTTTASEGEGRWEFSFRNTPNFARGTLVVESGQLLSLEGDRVVFRLSGAPGERVRFRFGLER